MLATFDHRRLLSEVLVVRTFALSALGVFIAAGIVPEQHQSILGFLSWIRDWGIGVAFFVELLLIASILRIAFASTKSLQSSEAEPSALNESKLLDLKNKSGLPHWFGRLLLWELNFWKRLGRLLFRR